jgi:hypothetical protein
MRRSKLSIAAAAATLLLALAVADATANRLSINAPTLRETWSALTFAAAGVSVSCAVTLDGSFHRASVRGLPVTKVVGALLGYLTRASVARPCTGGEAAFLTERLPWHLRYENFTGNLPVMTGVKFGIHELAATFNAGFGVCLASSEARHPLDATAIIEARSTVTGTRFDETDAIPATGTALCPLASLSLAGTGSLTQLSGAALRVTLI